MSVGADVGTAGINIPATPGELLAGAAIGGGIGWGLGTTADATTALLDKMASEIKSIVETNREPEAEQYSLRAIRSGKYLNVRGGTTYLKARGRPEIWAVHVRRGPVGVQSDLSWGTGC
jgi:hypothetical protein